MVSRIANAMEQSAVTAKVEYKNRLGNGIVLLAAEKLKN